MGRPELGTKLACTGCSERFYDLNRSPAVCPKCGVRQPLPKPRVYSKPGESWRARRQPVPVAAEAEERTPVVASEVEDSEEAAEDDADTDAESDGESDEEPAAFERSP